MKNKTSTIIKNVVILLLTIVVIVASNLITINLEHAVGHLADNSPNNGVDFCAGFYPMIFQAIMITIALFYTLFAVIKTIRLVRLKKKNPAEFQSQKQISAASIIILIFSTLLLIASSVFLFISQSKRDVNDRDPNDPLFYTASQNFSGRYYGGDCVIEQNSDSNSHSLILSDPDKAYKKAKAKNSNIGEYNSSYVSREVEAFEWYLVQETVCQVADLYEKGAKSLSQTQLNELAGSANSELVKNGTYTYKLGPSSESPNDSDVIIMTDKVCYNNEYHKNSIAVYSPLIHGVRVCGFKIIE